MRTLSKDELESNTPPYDFGPRLCMVCGCRFHCCDDKPNCPLCGGFAKDEPYLAEKKARYWARRKTLEELTSLSQELGLY